jgi:hypothetical protein
MAFDTGIDTHLESHLIDPRLLRADFFDGFVGGREGALLGLIEAATGKAIYRWVVTDEPFGDMIEDEAEGLEAAG